MSKKSVTRREEVRKTVEYEEAVTLLKHQHKARCFLRMINAQIKSMKSYSGLALQLAKEEVDAELQTDGHLDFIHFPERSRNANLVIVGQPGLCNADDEAQP